MADGILVKHGWDDARVALDQSSVESLLPKSARCKTSTRAGCLNLVANSTLSVLDNCTPYAGHCFRETRFGLPALTRWVKQIASEVISCERSWLILV